MIRILLLFFFFFFNDTATTEIYTLSLHDALPIYQGGAEVCNCLVILPRLDLSDSEGLEGVNAFQVRNGLSGVTQRKRSEEHTSELQSRLHLVCRLLLEKKKKKQIKKEKK